MKRSRIFNTVLVPASDLVGNEAGFFQSNSAQQRVDLRSGRRVRQSLVCDRAHNFVSKRAVRLRCRKSNGGKNRKQEQISPERFHSKVRDNTGKLLAAQENQETGRDGVVRSPRRHIAARWPYHLSEHAVVQRARICSRRFWSFEKCDPAQ